MTTNIRTRRLTRSWVVTVFAVCQELVGGEAPASQQCSTPVITFTPAAPQCISGRTSYLRVRLAFHPYPPLIRNFCNSHRFGPSRPVTDAAAWSWVAHTVSGLLDATTALFTLAFARPPATHCLKHATPRNSSDHSPKGTRSRRFKMNPGALTAWTRSVSGSVSLPSPGCFSPFPHGTVRYRSRSVSCLGPWSARLPTGFLVSRGTRDGCAEEHAGWYRTVTCSGRPFQAVPVHRVPSVFGMHPEPHVSQPPDRKACTLGTVEV